MSATAVLHNDADRARNALWSLDAGCDHETWVRIGMAAKAAELDFDDFNDWSATAGNYGGKTETLSTWASFKAGAGVNAGTLFWLARQNGWQDTANDNAPQPAQTKLKMASEYWEGGAPAPAEHAYIVRKGGKPDGLRVVTWPLRGWAGCKGRSLEGWLMVPVYAASGALVSVQFIGPNKGEKLNAPGCRMAGTFTVGAVAKGATAYIVEGIGHAWSVNAVTGCAAVVSFGAGNIEKTAAAIKAAGAVPVIVPDRGKESQAQGIARSHGYDVAPLPGDMPDGADINDLHQERGADAVRAVLTRQALTASPANDNHPIDIHDMPPVLISTWPHMSGNGQPLNTIPNLERLLENYGFTVRYDVIRKDMAITYPGQCGSPDNYNQAALNTVTSLCALNRLPKGDVPAFLLNIGDRHLVNPVMDFITVTPWDGRSRFADLLATVQTRDGFDRDLFALMLRRWLISAVAAAAMPSGFWSKGVLVFQGAQSLGKTAWFRSLVPSDLRRLVKVGAIINPDNKDTVISAVSHWLVELGELDGTLRKADIARLKEFISQDVDQFRRPYGRSEEKFQRRTVFFASVNPERFLADDTGNVRWWTVPVASLDYQHGIDIQQLWAEVFEWFKAGERWWLDRDEEQRLEAMNANHEQADPVEELIASRYDFTKPATRRLTATEILIELGYDKPTRSQLNSTANAMKKHFGDWKKSNGRKVYDAPPLRRDNRPF